MTARRALIAGAGDAGTALARALAADPAAGILPLGFLHDDPHPADAPLPLPWLGPIDAAGDAVRRHDVHDLIATTDLSPASLRRLVIAAVGTGRRVRVADGPSAAAVREACVEDLLRREPVPFDATAVRGLAAGRTVLVTGAGGSIGRELCFQLATLGVTRLVALGQGEHSIFELQQELARRYPSLTCTPVIANVRDAVRVTETMARWRPTAVFHAAAHKHVPLMEENVAEAVANNVLGTLVMADAAAAHGVEHFVMISTDKAVRPLSVMGATKRAAEQVVQRAAARTERNFTSVRFGNILGSRGSVVPLFERQVREGGPVLVTDPEMRRYFMPIPESVALVLQATALGRGGEVFVLDMGEPVRIVDLAGDVIRLAGLEPGRDVAIAFTGVRPGEKLHEEPFFGPGQAEPTAHPRVRRARHVALPPEFDARLAALLAAVGDGSSSGEVRAALRRVVPEFGAA